MKNTLRIALPPLAALHPHSLLPYAWYDRRGQLARQGEDTAQALATAYRQQPAEAILHPDDVITAEVNVPWLGRARHDAVVRGALEPLVLGELDDLAIGYSPRGSEGRVNVAWTPRDLLERACATLTAQGLRLRSLIPASELGADGVLHEKADPRWQAATPAWSIALPRQASGTHSRWRAPLRLLALAALLWLAGLNIYAARQEGEAQALRARMNQQVKTTFAVPVVLDPVRQAQQGLQALQTGQGQANTTGLLPLARSTARLLPSAQDNLHKLSYADQALTLQLMANEDSTRQLAATPKLIQEASAAGLKVEQHEKDPIWRFTRN